MLKVGTFRGMESAELMGLFDKPIQQLVADGAKKGVQVTAKGVKMVAAKTTEPRVVKTSESTRGVPCSEGDLLRDTRSVKVDKVNKLYDEIIGVLQKIKDTGGVKKGALLVRKLRGMHATYKLDTTHSHTGSVLEVTYADEEVCRHVGGKMASSLNPSGMTTAVHRDGTTLFFVLGNLKR